MLNWNKINIKQGQLIKLANEKDNRIDQEIYLCSAVFGKPIEYYENLSIDKLKAIIAKTNEFGNYPDPKQIAPFRHGLNLYKFKTQASQLSKQEFVALQAYADKGIIENLHSIMAILSTRYTIFPPREKPQSQEIKEDIFLNHLPFGMAYSYAVFFSAYFPTLQAVGQAYLEGASRAAKELTL